MIRVSQIRFLIPALTISFSMPAIVDAQSPDTPMTRMRPIGAPSAVDQFRSSGRRVETAYRQVSQQSPVRQTVMLQQGEIQSPPLTNSAPPAPITLPANTAALPVQPAATPATDQQTLPQPQLGGGFATLDNCNLVSQPSAYSAAFGYGCGNPIVPQSYTVPCTSASYATAPVAEIPAPAVMPSARPAQIGAPLPSLFTLGQEQYQVQVGQGLWGQPKAYVPGQPWRNWLRYFSP